MENDVWIINGPNLNLLGVREPKIYGKQSFPDFLSRLKATYAEEKIQYYQTNHEGNIIDKLHDIGFTSKGIIINPGAYAHYSIAIADAIKAITSPIVEVHISNIYKREDFRHVSITGDNCDKMITGEGLYGYALAMDYLLNLLNED